MTKAAMLTRHCSAKTTFTVKKTEIELFNLINTKEAH